jgi:zinc transporter ZupT
MVKFGSTENKQRIVLLLSLATSILLVVLFLLGSLLTNISRGEIAYTQVDMAAGSIFVFVISMIISLSLWPRVADRLEDREDSNK